MTEEIIIDGVDVAKCGYFCETDKECSICGMGTSGEDTFCRDCKDNSNCYYKQLKRLEQENKELKAETLQWKQIKDMANNNKYRSALEEIREIVASTFAKQRPYKEDFTEIETIINEVLK